MALKIRYVPFLHAIFAYFCQRVNSNLKTKIFLSCLKKWISDVFQTKSKGCHVKLMWAYKWNLVAALKDTHLTETLPLEHVCNFSWLIRLINSFLIHCFSSAFFCHQLFLACSMTFIWRPTNLSLAFWGELSHCQQPPCPRMRLRTAISCSVHLSLGSSRQVWESTTITCKKNAKEGAKTPAWLNAHLSVPSCVY